MTRKSLLSNGVRVLTEAMPHSLSASIGIWVENGSRYEEPHENGVCHLIEHLLFKGTKKRTAAQIAEQIDAVGGVLNAFTGKEYTCYYAKVLGDDLGMATDLLADLLLESLVRRRGDQARAAGRVAGDFPGRGHARRFHPRPLQPEILGGPSAGAADRRQCRDGDRRSIAP